MIATKKELEFFIMADRIMNGYPAKRTLISILKETRLVGGSKVLIIKYLRHLRRYAYYRNIHKGRFSLNSIMLLWERFRLEKYAVRLGFSIGYNSLGYGVVIPHYGTIAVNGNSYIGPLSVLHTCTCVAGGGKTTGEGFYLSTGCQLVGKFDLGNFVCVAAHSLVNKKFGDNVLIAGAPASCKRENYFPWWNDSEKYLQRVKMVKRLREELI